MNQSDVLCNLIFMLKVWRWLAKVWHGFLASTNEGEGSRRLGTSTSGEGALWCFREELFGLLPNREMELVLMSWNIIFMQSSPSVSLGWPSGIFWPCNVEGRVPSHVDKETRWRKREVNGFSLDDRKGCYGLEIICVYLMWDQCIKSFQRKLMSPLLQLTRYR